jgi:hypothetical protein
MTLEIHDNLEELLKEVEVETPIQRERRAELTLLALLEDMPQEERVPFLKEAGVSSDEFFRIYEKWERVLIKYREEKEKQNAGI